MTQHHNGIYRRDVHTQRKNYMLAAAAEAEFRQNEREEASRSGKDDDSTDGDGSVGVLPPLYSCRVV